MATSRKKTKKTKKSSTGFDFGQWFIDGLEWWGEQIADGASRLEKENRARLLRQRAIQLRQEALKPRTRITFVPPSRLLEEAEKLEDMAAELEEEIA